MLLTDLYSKKQAHLLYQVIDSKGPFEEAIHESLQLFCDVFECAVKAG